MRQNLSFLFTLLVVFATSGCEEFFDRFHDPKPRTVVVTDFASGLHSPFGIEVDTRKQLWVTEAGTGKGHDGQLTLITPEGMAYPVIEGFHSAINPEGLPYGLTHLALQDGILWILHGGEGHLYRFNIHDFELGEAPLQADDLEYEEIGDFVRDYPFKEPIDKSNPYNLTIGPGGDLFIVDAGANAIIRRQAGTGTLSVFTVFPDLPNPAAGPPAIDVVPTGITFDGRRFLVSSLTGFPFLPGRASIYQVDLDGNASVYQTGFTTLTDIELGRNYQPLVSEFATFGDQGYIPNTGRLVEANRTRINPVVSGLNFPTAIKKSAPDTYYLGSSLDGKIKKVVYQ